jgi:hypothetical protein
MSCPELAHLELLAEVDTLMERLQRWIGSTPTWQPAETCQALVARLVQRADALRLRLESPLVVATLGGTGTGKSALVNALVGVEVVTAGRARPTTLRPALICRPDISPPMIGIDASAVDLIQRDLPALRDLILIDCPDPDTTEDAEAAHTNLARLRPVLAHCDVLLVTGTQQKYRSARVADELAAAAPGARLVFVQTHAGEDDDIRPDWQKVLAPRYATGHIFRVDSLAALSDSQAGRRATGEFGQLLDLLTRQLAGAAGNRIRRANVLDLVANTLTAAAARLDSALPSLAPVQAAIAQQRGQLATRLAGATHAELLAHRRQWESRVLTRITSRWGFSPFSLLLRVFQGLGGLATRVGLLRARTPAQMALWGALEGARSWRGRQLQQQAERAPAAVAGSCWEEGELRSAAIVLAGYAAEAGLPAEHASLARVVQEASQAAIDFARRVADQLDGLLDRLAVRHTGWFTRLRYELLLLAMLVMLGYRLGKNFFYDSWLATHPVPVFGLEFYGVAGFWLLLWCVLLFWAFSTRLRRGLRDELGQLAALWNDGRMVEGLFSHLEADVQRAEQFRSELAQMAVHVAELRGRLSLPDEQLGHVR